MSKKRLYFDMDGVIVDFVLALEAVRKLNEKYDCYILSTDPWNNPSAWSDKVEWITKHLEDSFFCYVSDSRSYSYFPIT